MAAVDMLADDTWQNITVGAPARKESSRLVSPLSVCVWQTDHSESGTTVLATISPTAPSSSLLPPPSGALTRACEEDRAQNGATSTHVLRRTKSWRRVKR